MFTNPENPPILVIPILTFPAGTDFARALGQSEVAFRFRWFGCKSVTPAKERHPVLDTGPESRKPHWIPAFAGMTRKLSHLNCNATGNRITGGPGPELC